MRRRPGEHGSISVVMAAVLGLAAMCALATAELGRAADLRARAQTAADAAALAAAQSFLSPDGLEPTSLAREYAERNGARLIRCRCPPGGREAVVTVAMDPLPRLGAAGEVRASARAVVDAPVGAAGLDPSFALRLGCLFDRVPGLRVVSGFRTREEQARLYLARPHLAAPPGSSNHELGLAADLGFADGRARLEAHAEAPRCGLVFPIAYEPWHVEPAPA